MIAADVRPVQAVAQPPAAAALQPPQPPQQLPQARPDALPIQALEDGQEMDEPITEIVHMHAAIRSELAALEAASAALASDGYCEEKLRVLDARFNFLWAMQRYHSKAEDEIIFPQISQRLRTLAKRSQDGAASAGGACASAKRKHGACGSERAAGEAVGGCGGPGRCGTPGEQHGVSAPYSCDHENEDRFFCAIDELLRSVLAAGDLSLRAQLVAQAVHKLTVLDTNLGFHLSREEKELLPLMRELFTHEEQLQLASRLRPRHVYPLAGERPADPVDAIRLVHDAIRAEFKDIELASRRVDPASDQQVGALAGRFRTLWGVVKDHSEGEDRVFFPALEERLRERGELNVSKSFGMEHDCGLALFEELHKLLQNAADPAGDPARRPALLADIRVRFATLADSLGLHLLKEEREILPQLRNLFSPEEQEAIMGRIIGQRPSATLMEMLPWVMQRLSASEGRNMMRHIRKVTNGTMFEKWLSCWWVFAEDESAAGRPAASRSSPASPPPSTGTASAMEEDGERDGSAEEVEAAIRAVARDPTIDVQAKTARIQALMTRRWRRGRGSTPDPAQPLHRHLDGCGASSPCSIETLPPSDLAPTYHDAGRSVMGCAHYQRSCKLRAACCGRFFTCRVCHDDASDHTMDRYATREILCMRCNTVQPVGPTCRSAACGGRPLARYYCHICKFFDDDGEKSIYHCPFCNICRMGRGLGIDFFHCMRCNACMAMSLREHRCLQNSLESNCPICNQFMFTSTAFVKLLRCGHLMHTECYKAYVRNQYTCPVCLKSLSDMSSLFAQLDALVASDVLPPEYAGRTSNIYCNDCEQKSTVRFHFLYHRCAHCASYNTRVT